MRRRFLMLTLGIAAAFAACLPAAAVSLPPHPEASCASKVYSQRAYSADDLMVVPGTLMVPGGGQINTADQGISMEKEVTVCIAGLYNWTYQQKNTPSTLRIAIGGHVLETIPPSTIGPPEQEYVNFLIHIDTANSPDWKEWAAIVEATRQAGTRLIISVATTQTKQLYESTFYADVAPYPDHAYFLATPFVLLLAVLIALAANSNLLRYTLGQSQPPLKRPPFSLGLVQMAFWFYLVVAAYVFICVTMRQAHIPIGSALGLLGISATTGLAAVFVDKQKMDPGVDERNKLVDEQAALNARVADLSAVALQPSSVEAAELSLKKARLAEIASRLVQLPPAVAPSSKGILADILNDGDGVSFHRFQIVIWTVVLGAVFVWGVYRNLSMPEFDPSLLTLMGISSGTYVGFKFPEKPKT